MSADPETIAATEDARALCWRAWPAGWLPVRGVMTVTGWQFVSNCVIFTEYGSHKHDTGPLSRRIIHHESERHQDIEAWRVAGDLLPVVDREDVATWACVLADLAKLAGLKGTGFVLSAPGNYGEQWDLITDTFGGGVELPVLYGDEAHWKGTREYYPAFDHMTDSPELAAVLATIVLREREPA